MKVAKRIRHLREDGGFSVLYVLLIGITALMGIMAVTDALVTAQRNVASQVYLNEASSGAENALQYAIGVVNTAAAQNKLSNLSSPIPIPSQIAGTSTVTVNITALPGSLLYGANSTPIWKVGNFPTTSNQGNPPLFFLLSASSKVYTYRRTINVILGPKPNSGGQIGSTGYVTPTNAYFNGALYGNQLVQISGVNVLFEPGYSPTASSYGQTIVSSNNQIQLSGSSTIYGSVNASSYSAPPIPPGAASSVMIEGNVSYTGSTNQPPSAFLPDPGGVLPTLGANVLGDGLAGGIQNQPGTISNNASQYANTLAEVPPSAGLAQFTSSGANVAIEPASAQPGAASTPVSSLGAITTAPSSTVSIASGQYVANSVSTTPTSTINLEMANGSGGTLAPVQLYLQGSSQQGVPLLLQGNLTTTGAPSAASNLQIFYNGNESIVVTMGAKTPNFYGQIYAPNANVYIDTTGGAFHGSVVANNLSVTGTGSFYYDPRTVNPAGGGPGAAAPGYTPNPSNPNLPSSFSVLSWQEQTTGAQ